MARIRIASSSGTSENTIVFSPAGGHSHNGRNSSLIDSTAYSIYDFSPTFVGTEINPGRAVRQENNRIAFEDLIKRVVNNSVLAPAGIRLEPGSLNGSLIIANTITANNLAANTITASEISAGTITANELSSNIVLINNRITSQNWDGTILANGTILSNNIGNTGWAITNTHAVFDSTLIRGSVAANSLVTPNLTISNTGAIISTSFNVTAGGNVTATNANITGTITSGSGSIGGWAINAANISGGSTVLYSNGQITNGNFTVSSAGALTATGASIDGTITANAGTIGGWTINPTSISAGSTTLNSVGSMTIGATTIAANGQITNGGYTLSSTGALTATGANITGTVTASDGGQIGDFFITSGALSASSLSDAIAGTSASMTLGVDGLIKTRIDVGSLYGTPYYTETYINRRESAGGIYIIGTASGGTSATEITSSFISTGTVLINGNSVATSLAGKSNNGHTHAYAADSHLHDSRYVNADGDSMTGSLNINSGNVTNVMQARRTYGAGANFIQFVNDSTGNAIGAIEFASTTTINYKTSSDKRLKENVTGIAGAFDLIKRINPVEYNFISEGPLHREHGFLAQDLYEQYPYPVCVGSDDLKENPWGIDYGKMTPLLTAALKEAIAKIEEMEVRIQTLEGV